MANCNARKCACLASHNGYCRKHYLQRLAERRRIYDIPAVQNGKKRRRVQK